jgi:O-antigen/teichoic acid export membrane protein
LSVIFLFIDETKVHIEPRSERSNLAGKYFYICSNSKSLQALIKKFFGKQMVQNTLIFSGSSILNRAIPFLMLPVLTYYLDPAAYGVVANFVSLLSLLIVFTGINTQGMLGIKYFNLPKTDFKLLVGNIVMILIISSVVLLIVMFLFSETLTQRFELPFNWLFIGLLCSIATFMNMVNLTLWQLEKKALLYASFTGLETLLNVGLSLVLIIGFGLTWEGRLLGIAFALVLFGLLSAFIIYYRGYMTFKFNKLIFSESLFFGLPLIPHNLSGWLRTGINVIIITELIGLHETGLYNTGVQFAMIVFFIGNGFNLALSPVIFEKLANPTPDGDLKLVKITYAFYGGILAITAVISLAAPWLIRVLLDEKYHESTPFIPWLAFAFAFFGMYLAVVNYLFYYKKTIILTIITLSCGVLNAGICWWLVGKIGPMGAAYSSLVTFALMFVAVAWYANRVHPLPWLRFKDILSV